MISRMSSIYGNITLFLYKNIYHLVLSESGEVPTDRRTSERRIMQVSSSVSNRYYTPYQTNTSVKYCAGFSQKEDGKLTPNETTENPGFAEFVDYQEFHKAWMSQGAETAFSYTSNNGFNAEANSISLVPGMSVRLSNGFRLAIGDYMVQALGDFKDNQAASESAAIAGALSHLIKVANGQIPMNMFYSKNQDNSAYAKIGLQAFGIDTSRPFTINEKTFHFDSDGQIRLGRGQYVSEEYETSIVSDETESGADVFLNEIFDFFATYTENNEVKDNIAIDFSRFAPNAPEEVKKAFSEAAEETGYYEYSGKGKMNYISQILVKQVENRQNGVENNTDVFGGSIASALQVAREMLYDLENPLKPDSQRSEDIIKYREQEKEFYKAFIEKLEMLEDKSVSKSEKYHRQPGEVPEEFAGMSFWDLINSGKGNAIPTVDKIVNAKNPEDGKIYLTFFTEDKISCYEPGGEKVWELEISNGEQRSLVKDFFENYTPDRSYVKEYYSDESLGRVSSKEFWIGYLENASSLNLSENSQEQSSLGESIDYSGYLRQKIDEIFVKIQNGDTEPTYQIGSQSFTEKEWETFLEKFDSIEEAIQELIKEEQARKEAEEAKQENALAGAVSAGNGIPGNHGLETWYKGEKVEWSADDTKYTDTETGISYYVKDGKHPYMTEEDTEKLKELCQETGEPWLKKFAEITGMIQQLDDNTTAFVGSNGTLIKSKDGKELFIDTSSLTYDAIMSLFKDLPPNGNYFDSSFWEERIRVAEAENVSAIDDGALLTAETTSCKYETADPDDDDITYITFYTTDGIRCKKLGAEDFEWTLTFENEEQYNKVMEFIGQFPSDWNMRFAAHENFWNDFLNDEIDMEGFMEFINGTNKGVPDYSVTVGDSMYIDTDKMQWAKYTNPLGVRFYTAEEMHQMQVEIIAANEAKLTKFTDWDAYEEMYKKNHPEYNGEKICCEYPGGPLYTVKEMAELQYRKMLERMGTTEEREQQKRDEWRKQMGYPGY